MCPTDESSRVLKFIFFHHTSVLLNKNILEWDFLTSILLILTYFKDRGLCLGSIATYQVPAKRLRFMLNEILFFSCYFPTKLFFYQAYKMSWKIKNEIWENWSFLPGSCTLSPASHFVGVSWTLPRNPHWLTNGWSTTIHLLMRFQLFSDGVNDH